MKNEVVAIVPAFNESDTIEATVRSLYETGQVGQVVVIDDGSGDDTATRAERAGATVYRLAENQGKTAALLVGVQQTQANILLFVDADLGSTAGLTVGLLTPIMEGSADMTIAAWPRAGSAGGFGVVKRFSQWLIHRTTGVAIDNPLSGQRAMRREVWACWRGAYGYGFEVAFTIDAIRAGKRIVEVPLSLTHRQLGRSWRGFLHRGRQLLHILLAVGRRCVKW